MKKKINAVEITTEREYKSQLPEQQLLEGDVGKEAVGTGRDRRVACSLHRGVIRLLLATVARIVTPG